MLEKNTDIIVIGAGIGGLSFALYLNNLSPDLNIKILAKSEINTCNTRLAQGGIASVKFNTKDSFESHINDTYLAGHKKGNYEVIEKVIKDAPNRIQDLLNWGLKFDKNGNRFDLHKEGGHQYHRILHTKDQTGKSLHQCLLEKIKKIPSIQILEYHQVENIVKTDNGFKLKVANLNSKQYYQTTNSLGSIGEGIYFAHQLGLKIKDFEKIQFHPTSFNGININPSFLISEAARGLGAHLINEKHQRFVFKYNTRGELAPRDIVSNAIWKEISHQNNENIYLDFTHLNCKTIPEALPYIYKTCKSYGYDLCTDHVPIKPAAHYQCGGIQVNLNGESSEKGIFAIGECAYTGLHGDNRLASNSLLESLYFANSASKTIAKRKRFNRGESYVSLVSDTPFSVLSVTQKEYLSQCKETAKQLLSLAFENNNFKKYVHKTDILIKKFNATTTSLKSHPEVFETKVILKNVQYLLQKKMKQKSLGDKKIIT
jgi:L-aspartate oxidase